MGYTHYWNRPQIIDVTIFKAIGDDLTKLLPALEAAGAALANAHGREEAEFGPEFIGFNGVECCDHEKNPNDRLRWPKDDLCFSRGKFSPATDLHALAAVNGLLEFYAADNRSARAFQRPHTIWDEFQWSKRVAARLWLSRQRSEVRSSSLERIPRPTVHLPVSLSWGCVWQDPVRESHLSRSLNVSNLCKPQGCCVTYSDQGAVDDQNRIIVSKSVSLTAC